MSIYLGDDGTMDTVLCCDLCGEEFRFNYAAYDDDTLDAAADEARYDAFVDDCIAEIEAEHECEDDE